MFEAFVMALAREMPVAAVAELVAEHDTRLWRVVRHYVGQAHGRQDWSGVLAVSIDETATRKGHRYATVVVEIDPQKERRARLLFMTPERTAASVGQFVEAMPAHGANPGAVPFRQAPVRLRSGPEPVERQGPEPAEGQMAAIDPFDFAQGRL